MTREAKVIIENGRYKAEVIRGEACARCRACSFGQQERVLVPLPEGSYTEGDTVTINLEDRRVAGAALLAYGVPFVGLIIGLIIGFCAFESELMQAACALAFTGAGLAYLLITERRRRQNGKYSCEIHKNE